MQSRIHGVLGELLSASHLERLVERPARTGPPTYLSPAPRTLADAIRQGEEIAEQERQRLGLRGAPLPELADLCAAQGVPVFALKLPDALSLLFISRASVERALVVNVTHDAVRQRLNESQRAAVQEILANRDHVMALEGVAGTGKTTALTAVRDAAEREGSGSPLESRSRIHSATTW